MLVSCPEYTEIGIWAAPEHRAMKEGQKGHGRRRRRCCFTCDVHKGEQMPLKSRCCALFGPLLLTRSQLHSGTHQPGRFDGSLKHSFESASAPEHDDDDPEHDDVELVHKWGEAFKTSSCSGALADAGRVGGEPWLCRQLFLQRLRTGNKGGLRQWKSENVFMGRV